MRQDVSSLEAFYASPLGKVAAQSLVRRIEALWGTLSNEDLLGIGFPTPLIRPLGEAARSCLAAMPAAQGALTWAATPRGISTVLTEEGQLPFKDGVFSRIILVHGLEEAPAPSVLLREVWRIMAPEGRLIVIAANRLGLWARAEATPFGQGRPWTRGQLTRLLNEALFQTTAWTHGLHMPPTRWAPVLALHDPWEKVGETVSRVMGGVVLVEAIKRLYAGTGPQRLELSPVKAVRARKGLARLHRD